VLTIFKQYTWQRVTIPSDGNYNQVQTISRGHYTCGIDFPALFLYIFGKI
jgi:hypothetical protein